MTEAEDAQPSVDFFAQLNAAADEAMPKLLDRIKDAVDLQGKKRINLNCQHCGKLNQAEIEVADVEEMRKILELFGSLKLRAKQAAQKDGDDSGRQAFAKLQEIAEMSDEDIATELAKLDAELASA